MHRYTYIYIIINQQLYNYIDIWLDSYATVEVCMILSTRYSLVFHKPLYLLLQLHYSHLNQLRMQPTSFLQMEGVLFLPRHNFFVKLINIRSVFAMTLLTSA